MSLLEDVIDTLLAGKPLEEKYRDYGLVGRYAGHRECHILPDWPLIYLSGEDPRFYKRGTANILLVSVAGYNPPLR
jgi:mRNA interferase YafQ